MFLPVLRFRYPVGNGGMELVPAISGWMIRWLTEACSAMSRTLTFPVRFLAVWPLDFFQAFVVFFFFGGSELRDSGSYLEVVLTFRRLTLAALQQHSCAILGRDGKLLSSSVPRSWKLQKQSGSYGWNGRVVFSSGYSRKHVVLLISRGRCWVTVILLCNGSHYLELWAEHMSSELQSCMILLVVLALFLESSILSILDHRDLLLVLESSCQ